METHILFDIFILLILLALNGLMSMAETSLISCKKSHIKAHLDIIPHAKTVDYLLNHPGEFLSALQIGITIISIFSGAYSGQQLAEPLSIWLDSFPWINGFGTPLAFGVVVLLLTYVSLLISELVPKRIALSHPEKIALYTAQFVYSLTRFSYYIVKILDVSTRYILRICGFREQSQHLLTAEDFQHIFKQGLDDGVISTFEHNTFKTVMQFNTDTAYSIMIPRNNIHMLDIEDTLDTMLAHIIKTPHRYYPVMQHNPEKILGIIDTKELFHKKILQENIDIRSLLQTPPMIQEESKAPDIVQCFHNQSLQIAVVINNSGTFIGIITPHDLLHSLIGTFKHRHSDT